jgi:hypothetical protein
VVGQAHDPEEGEALMPDAADEAKVRLSKTVAQFGVADALGNQLIDPQATDRDSTSFDVLDPRFMEYVQFGLLNGSFARGPGNSTGVIEPSNNPMPDWNGPVQVSGGAVQCSWVQDPLSPSNYNLRFTVLAGGAAGDEGYVEQIVLIGGDRSQLYIQTGRFSCYLVSLTSGSVTAYGSIQYLKADRVTTTGALLQSGVTPTVGLLQQAFFVPPSPVPSDAYYARVRLGVQRVALPASGSAQLDFSSVRIEKSLAYLSFPDLNNTANTPGYLSQQSGIMYLAPGSATPLVGVVGGLWTQGRIVNSQTILPTTGVNKNDWSPTGFGTCNTMLVKNTAGAAINVSGWDATVCTEGQIIDCWNDRAGSDIVLLDASALSLAGNRMHCPGAANLTVRKGGGWRMQLLTDSAPTQRWRVQAI